jgi:hypothetical protein
LIYLFICKVFWLANRNEVKICGETGIRTPEGLASLTVFKTAAFNHSAISPKYLLRTYHFKTAAFPALRDTPKTDLFRFSELCLSQSNFHSKYKKSASPNQSLYGVTNLLLLNLLLEKWIFKWMN